jgi:hypothetical protein
MKPEVLKKLYDKRQKERTRYDILGLTIIKQDKLPESVNFEKLLNILQKRIPEQLFDGIEEIIIGNFDFLINSAKESVYKDGKIYITNNKKDEEEIYTAIIHELAHALEQYRAKELFFDGEMKKEFIRKRLKLYQIINNYYEEINLDKNYYVFSNYSPEFDDFLIYDIGYGKLGILTDGLFISPYAITSLSEYFARNFEEFFSNSYERKKYLTKVSPVVYNKIVSIIS